MIFFAILSVIIGVSVALYLGITVANMVLYKKLDSNKFGSKTVQFSDEESREFEIISDACPLTADMKWYSEYINNPIIRKKGQGL